MTARVGESPPGKSAGKPEGQEPAPSSPWALADAGGRKKLRGQRFGGDWTQDKLGRVERYLVEYTKIFRRNPKARYYDITYVDAFAGTGYRAARRRADSDEPRLLDDVDALQYREGSAAIALGIEPAFDHYLFIERSPSRARQLDSLKARFSSRAPRISVVRGDANTGLRRWCQETDWSRNRAVVFLDPHGMQVAWATVEALAKTQGVDLWYLFPLGQAVNRLLTRSHPPPGRWSDSLTVTLGTDAWREAFYGPSPQRALFTEGARVVKEADFRSISRFFVRRLESVFTRVAPNPLPLRNSRNVPIFLLCFAAGNPKGADIAVRIAGHILGR